MKTKSILILSTLTILTFSSCATTSQTEKSLTANPESTSKTREITRSTAEAKTSKEEAQFLSSIENLSIQFTQTPKIANVNRPFSSPYSFEVKKDGNLLPNFSMTISYPSAKTDGNISFTETVVFTDENGKYTFDAQEPSFAANTKLSVYPTPINNNVAEKAKAVSASADWKVKADIITKGAVLFIWDYNEKDRPINNSYDVLSEFRSRGMSMVGNAPVNETSYIGKPLATLYKDNYAIIEDSYGYLIVGTIKFIKPVEECEGGYLCSLIADIKAVNMKNGEEVFASTFTNETVGASWTKCVNPCKEKLAEKIVDALVYGL